MQEETSTTVIGEDAVHRLTLTTQGIRYVPDIVKHIYGKSSRRPLEEWFLDELRFFHEHYPGYEIFTLGSSLVFGEKFVTYLTICEFAIETEQDFGNLKRALRESDQAIRKKFLPMWKWDIAARKDFEIVFMVGHMDFAYFLQHRQEFRKAAHGHYMKSFVNDRTDIRSKDYKVLHDGSIVPFSEDLLNAQEAEVFKKIDKIKYETRRVHA